MLRPVRRSWVRLRTFSYYSFRCPMETAGAWHHAEIVRSASRARPGQSKPPVLPCLCRAIDKPQIGFRQDSHSGAEAKLADRCDLVCHGFSRVGCSARNRHDLNSVQGPVRGVIAYDHGGPGLPHFAAERWIEIDPPKFTAEHRGLRAVNPRPGPPSTRPLRAPDPSSRIMSL